MVTKDGVMSRDESLLKPSNNYIKRLKLHKPSKITSDYYANERTSSPGRSPRSPGSRSEDVQAESRSDTSYRPQRPQMTSRRVLRMGPPEPSSHSMRTTMAQKSPKDLSPPSSGKTSIAVNRPRTTKSPRSNSRNAQKPTKPSNLEKKPNSTKSVKPSISKRSRGSSSTRKAKTEPLLSKDKPRVAANTTTKQKSLYLATYNPPNIASRYARNQARIEDDQERDPSPVLNSPNALAAAKRKARAVMGRQEPPDIAYSISGDNDRDDKYVVEGSVPKDSVKENRIFQSAMEQSEGGYVEGLFTDNTHDFTANDTYDDTIGDDTFGDDTMGDPTFSGDDIDTKPSHRSLMRYRFSSLSEGSTSFGDSSVIIKQQVAWGCIGLSALQFAILTTQVLLCGVAALSINPTIGPYPDAFSEWGGKNTYLLLDGQQYFRYITPIFLHVGYLHLIVNMCFQLETCAYLEREWGFLPWIFIYLVSGFGSCLAASAVDSNLIGVCSSGALMGLFGARISQAIVWTVFETTDEYIGQGPIIFERLGGIVCSAAVVFLLTFLTYIDWSGHLGGLFTGFLMGFIYFAHALKKRKTRSILTCVGLLGLLLGGLILGVILFHYAQYDEELADACNYFRNLYPEDYSCECQAFS